MGKIKWHHPQEVDPHSYTCGFCGRYAGSNKGYNAGQHKIYICSYCEKPTYVFGSIQSPEASFGNEVRALPEMCRPSTMRREGVYRSGHSRPLC